MLDEPMSNRDKTVSNSVREYIVLENVIALVNTKNNMVH
mgnify:CR=1 FL=1